MEQEVWKPVLGFEDYYSVSNYGNIKRIKGKERLLKTSDRGQGYFFVCLSSRNNRTQKNVHRIVLESFVGVSCLDIDHKNGIKSDNRLVNLEYVTKRENCMRFKLRTKKESELGYCFHRGRYETEISIDGKGIFIGSFGTKEEANSAYLDVLRNGKQEIKKYRKRKKEMF